MSANYVVDLNPTVDVRASVAQGSGASFTVGRIADLLQANTLCNVYCANGLGGSGAIEVRIQTSDSVLSGTFTDPTSGLARLMDGIASGGVVFFNSGIYASGHSSPCASINNAPLFHSGGQQFVAFQRPHRYARLIVNSGVFPSDITAGFLSQKKNIGSGAGFTFSPGSGVVEV